MCIIIIMDHTRNYMVGLWSIIGMTYLRSLNTYIQFCTGKLVGIMLQSSIIILFRISLKISSLCSFMLLILSLFYI